MPGGAGLAKHRSPCQRGSGLQAIQFWHEGQHEALMAYCMDDARLTYALCEKAEGIRWTERWTVRLRQAAALELAAETMKRPKKQEEEEEARPESK